MQIDAISHLAGHPAIRESWLETEWIYTTRRYPLFWHHIAKNSGTFLKHLLYALDRDQHATRKPMRDQDRAADALILNPAPLVFLRGQSLLGLP